MNISKKTKGGTLYHTSMLINNINGSGFELDVYVIYIIDGQNATQIEEYKQLNNTNKWNPCIPMPFVGNKGIFITFANNGYNSFRDWYPLEICDYPNNFANYKNQYLFDGGHSFFIYNLTIDNYIINYNTNYPIAIATSHLGWFFSVHHGTFINISSTTTDPLFYGNLLWDYGTFEHNLFHNISSEMIYYTDVKFLFLFFVYISEKGRFFKR